MFYFYIDRAVLNEEVKPRKENLTMEWKDYKKAYGIIWHSWMSEGLSIFSIADNIRELISFCMKKWKVNLYSVDTHLGKVDLRRRIFHAVYLAPLIFVLSLIPSSIILRKAKAGITSEIWGKNNHLFYLEDLKHFSVNEKELDSSIITLKLFSKYIETEIGIGKCALWIMGMEWKSH